MADERAVALQFRDSLLESERWLDADGLAQLRGGVAPEAVDRCRRERGVLAVRLKGEYLFPAFQFLPRPGETHPRMSDLLAVLPDEDHGWTAAFWCFSPTLKLGGSRPADLFLAKPDDVIDAARRDFSGDLVDW